MIATQDGENNSSKVNSMKKYHDAMIAVEYITHELKHNKIHDLAQILEDITQLYAQTKNIANQSYSQDELDEYHSILYAYFIEKYYKNIKVDAYKNKILDFFKNELQNLEI